MSNEKPPGPDPEVTAELARKKAHAAEMTISTWHSLARAAGVQHATFQISEGLTKIKLEGRHERRTVAVEEQAKSTEPFALRLVLALEAFRAQLTDPVGVVAEAPLAAQPTLEVQRIAPGEIGEIRTAVSVDLTKPAKAGAGQRRPLSLPLCKQCKAQPVYNTGAEFCGGECARQWHIESIAKQKGIKL